MKANPVELLVEESMLGRDVCLFRYMQLSTLLLLLDGKVFFPSVANLNRGDPFEGELFCEPEWLMSQFHAQQMKEELCVWLRDQANKLEKHTLIANETDPRLRSRILAKIYTREYKERRAAWCWFQSDLESAGMWSVYGHKGIAVRTSLERLQDSLPIDRSFQMAQMRYVDRRPSSENAFDAEGKDRNLILRPHLTKAAEYAHEREFRVVTVCPPRRGGILIENPNWKSLIEEIIISPLLPAQEALAIEAMLKKYSWSSQVGIIPSKLLADSSMESDDAFQEAIRPDNGGCYEQDLPAQLVKL